MDNVFLVRYPESPIPLPEKGTLSIGRGYDNSVVLSDPRISRHHAQIEWQESRELYVLCDLGSSNGTYLNGRKISPHDQYPLDDWNKIRITSNIFTLRCVDGPWIIENEFNELRDQVQGEVTEIIGQSELATMQQPALTGDLEHLCPVEIFQMIELGRKTGNLTLTTCIGDGTFAINKGQVISARFGNDLAENALFDVLKCNEGTFAFTPKTEITEKPQIFANTTALLMEGCRLLDEANVRKGKRSDALLFE
jgi:pSer/pThr/pTyr-binding forkhead associated (FHA) protein